MPPMPPPWDEDKLRAFGGLIVRLQMGGDLSREEARGAFDEIWAGSQPDLQQGAFIAALRAKGETKDELVGVAQSHNDEWDKVFPHKVEADKPHLGIVGVGMDTLKTINVSSGAAIIAAACGVYVHKVGAPGMTGVSGSAQVFAVLGVDADAPPDKQVASTAACRLGFTSVVGAPMLASGILRVLSQLRCGTSLHLAGPMGFHNGERHKIIGVPHPSQVSQVIHCMKELGYQRALVNCGSSYDHPEQHLDELSTIGPSLIAELHDNGHIEEYELEPKEAGLKAATYADICTHDTMMGNIQQVARVIAGEDTGPRLDLLALNAAAAMKLMGEVDSLGDGVEKARAAVERGDALAQLHALIEHQNADPAAGKAQLAQLLGKG